MQQVWEKVGEALRVTAQKYETQAEKKRRPQTPFHVGQQMYLLTKYLTLRIPSKKLAPKYIGPFTIVQVINPVTVHLRLPPLLGKIQPVFHSSLLRPLRMSSLRDTPPSPPPSIKIREKSHYVIEEVLDYQWHRGCLQYLVLWKE